MADDRPGMRWQAAAGRAAAALAAGSTLWLGQPGTAAGQAAGQAADAVRVSDLAAHFEREVTRRLEVPPAARETYLALLQQALTAAGLSELPPQHLLLVDRSPQVQMLAVLLRTPDDAGAPAWHWIGATSVSTGSTGRFDHFRTPLGVFEHTLANPDFRAEGTFNDNGIRGYGVKGMRVFDFGWAQAERGWGGGGLGQMRLQMHATDPDQLEQRLGRVDSKGCIRIPASLNQWLDRHGTLDADYLQAMAGGHPGKAAWVMRADREPLPWPGRWLVIVDSGSRSRPGWAVPAAVARTRRAAQAGAAAGAGVC